MNPEDLLSTDKFTRPQAPRPKRVGGEGGSRPGFGLKPQFGTSRGGFSGGFGGGNRGGFNNRGGPSRGGFNNRGRS